MPRKGKGVRRIIREEHRFLEKKKQSEKYRRKNQYRLKKSLREADEKFHR